MNTDFTLYDQIYTNFYDVNEPSKLIADNNDIHIDIIRQGRKSITIVRDVDKLNCDLNILKSKLSSKLSCSCSIKSVMDKDTGINKKIFKLTGDQRREIKKYLLVNKIVDNEADIKLHG